MSILLTGARGFLGTHLIEELKNHEVITLGRHQDDHIRADISDRIPKLPKTELVVHAAGKAHQIPGNDREAKVFHDVNFQGTLNLAQRLVLDQALPRTFVFISTVAVYGLDTGIDVSESTPLSGTTPYAKSKIDAEKYLLKWGQEHGVGILILRLPLIVGNNAPGNLGAMVKNIRRGTYARIGTGEARRSMVLASDVGKLIPTLIGKEGIFHLTDGEHPSFALLEDHIGKSLGKKILTIPPILASCIAKLGDIFPPFPFNTYRYSKIKQSLTFSDQLAAKQLAWKPTPVLDGFVP